MTHPIEERYNGSFNNVAFWQQSQGGADAVHGAQKAVVSWIHYPGSDDNSRVSSGKAQRELVLTVAATTANLNSLAGLLNTQHTLVYAGGTTSAWLDYVQDRKDVPNRGQGTMVLGFSGIAGGGGGGGSTVPATAILTEAGDPILTETGDYIIME